MEGLGAFSAMLECIIIDAAAASFCQRVCLACMM
jgi:hypothetical protein